VNLDGSVPDGEIRAIIDHAYEVVVTKFLKYIQKNFPHLPLDKIKKSF
jgi:predicted DNA-binding protein (MmcQ/YjbR family)